MRLLKLVKYMSVDPESGSVASSVVATFVVAGVEAQTSLPLPASWEMMSRAEKIAWARQEIINHLTGITYREPGEVIFPDAIVQEQAAADFEALPGWATWSAGEAETWIELNVTSLATAKTALKAMAKAIVYLRDRTIPK